MVRDTVIVIVFFICHCRPVFGCCCFGKSFSTCIWLPTDLPPSDEQNLEIQGSVTNCSDAVTAGQGENMFNDRQYCKYITLQNSHICYITISFVAFAHICVIFLFWQIVRCATSTSSISARFMGHRHLLMTHQRLRGLLRGLS